MTATRRIMLLLAILIIASLFLPKTAFAQSRPWDCAVVLSYEGQEYTYRLSDNLTDLNDWSKQNRGVYLSSRLKKEIISSLIADGYTLIQAVCYCLPNFMDYIQSIMSIVDKQPVDATVEFVNGTFKYSKEVNGRQVDLDTLCSQLYQQLACENALVLPTQVVAPTITTQQLKQITALRGSFSTSFASSGNSRSKNIALATSSFASLTVSPNQTVSFNQLVGARTAQRGYAVGKIIVDGKYVDGVGGGVCQVSTTLYNALLLADITINNRSRHSLVSSYVDVGFDAMVSSATDFVFTNTTQHNIYISARVTKDKRVIFNVYGAELPYKIVRESIIVSQTPPPQQNINDTNGKYANRVKFTDESYVLIKGSSAIKSKSYLKYVDGDKVLKKVLISQDSYKSSPKVVVWGTKLRAPILSPIQ